MKLKTGVIVFLFIQGIFGIQAQTYQVHSHNDYEQQVPFWKAISAGVSSMEADIFLVGKELLVAHTQAELNPQRTFKALYLEPLMRCLELGLFDAKSMQLLIDVKSESYSTLEALQATLQEYPELLKHKGLTFVVSGNRPKPSEYVRYPNFISFDYQSLDTINDASIVDKIGLISLSFQNLTEWNGKGRLVREDLEKITLAIQKAHAIGKPFRFWATPDSKTAWKAMAEAGVDYINTDYPFECVQYVNSLSKRIFENTDFSMAYTPTFHTDGSPESPKNVIFLIGDGNGLAQISATALANGGSLSLTQLKNIGFLKTQSSDDFTTDSAGSATAMATGIKVPNRSIGVDAKGTSILNVTELLHARKFTTALISTDEITGATPASFFAHQKDRSMTNGILKDLETSKLDLFVASGSTTKGNTKELSGFRLVGHLDSLTTQRTAYLFPTDTIPLPLHVAVKNVLKTLDATAKPFFLMVEGAKIDSYGHANRIDGIINEGIVFDKAVSEALKFADLNKNTLVVITADHETGGLTLPQGNMDKHLIEADFTTDDHTGIFVPIFSYGPRSHLFQGVYDNNEVFEKLRNALQL